LFGVSIRSRAIDLKWMVKRLRAMGPAEIFHRIGEQYALRVMKIRHQRGREVGEDLALSIDRFEFCKGNPPKLPPLSWKMPADPEEIDDLLAGKMKIGGWKWQWRPDAAVWHEAPDTGRVWPEVFFGSISYRPGNRNGDIRVAWEPSRLQQLVGLGLLARGESGNVRRRATALLEAQFLSWVEANPYLTGIHYISAMECALRLIAVCHAVDLVRDDLEHPEQIWSALLRLVKQHAQLIEKRLSLHSSAGNHTLAESAGLVYAGVLFPEFQDAARWRSLGLSLLEQEADRQILPDGGGAEQAFGYLKFAVDLFELVAALLAHRNQPIPSILQEANRRGRRFLNDVADREGNVPPIGDGDHGSALSPWLRFSSERERKEEMISFDESGYSLLRRGRSLLLFDHGPLGMAPLCGHGHADALSIVLRVGENPILIDPGTFSYADPEWQTYFRSTTAHNTVTVDRQDQAVQEAPFIWSQPFHAACVYTDRLENGGGRFLAFHSGYARLGVTHWRALLFRPLGYWLIWDFLAGVGKHLLELHWHLGVPVVQEGERFLFSDLEEGGSISIKGGEITAHRGETDPILGWTSPIYGKKEPITTVRIRYEGALPHAFFTQVTVGPNAASDFPGEADLEPLMKWIS
jgi:hypothetical protein